MPNPSAPAADAGDTSDARDAGIATVADAVAELERREQARRAEKKADAEKSKKAEATRRAATSDEHDVDPEDPDADPEGEEDDDKPPRKDAKKKDDKPAKKKAAASDDDEGETDEADTEDDDQADADLEDDAEDDEGTDDEGDDDQADDDAEDDDKPKKGKQEPQRLKLRVADRDIETTPDEVSAYLTEAAQDRHTVAQERQALRQQAEQLAEHGRVLSQIAAQLIGDEPNIALAQQDPGAYIAAKSLRDQRLAVLQQLQGATRHASATSQGQQQQALREFVQRESQALLKAMPELADPEKRAAFHGRIQKVAQRYGLSPQELSNAFDHRSFLMLRDLVRLHDMEAERKTARQKLKGAPPLKTPEQRATRSPRDSDSLRVKKATSDFKKSGRTMRDLRAWIERTSRD